MYIEIDLTRLPPATRLCEAEDATSFKATVILGDHTFVSPNALLEWAGPLADDAEWRAGFEKMLAFAGEHGWTDEAGNVRAHVEIAKAPSDGSER